MDEPQRPMADSDASPTAYRLGTGGLVESKLRSSAYLSLQHLSCEFRAGVLTLRGRLPSYYLKQVALAVVSMVEGVQHIDDQIEVVAPAAPPSTAN
jgi:hypothetical protein